jgi:pyridoxamine 5'-phosphate oxidase
MDFLEYVKFASENPLCHVATVDGDQPRVRPMTMWRADKTGFYFESKSVKRLRQQLEKNPKVELCFYSSSAMKVMRVSGQAEFIDDMEVRERVFRERPRMKQQGVKGPEDPLLTVFAVRHGEAYFWTMAENMKESEIPRVRF